MGLARSALWRRVSYTSIVNKVSVASDTVSVPVSFTATCSLFCTLFTTFSFVLTFVLHAVYLATCEFDSWDFSYILITV